MVMIEVSHGEDVDSPEDETAAAEADEEDDATFPVIVAIASFPANPEASIFALLAAEAASAASFRAVKSAALAAGFKLGFPASIVSSCEIK